MSFFLFSGDKFVGSRYAVNFMDERQTWNARVPGSTPQCLLNDGFKFSFLHHCGRREEKVSFYNTRAENFLGKRS